MRAGARDELARPGDASVARPRGVQSPDFVARGHEDLVVVARIDGDSRLVLIACGLGEAEVGTDDLGEGGGNQLKRPQRSVKTRGRFARGPLAAPLVAARDAARRADMETARTGWGDARAARPETASCRNRFERALGFLRRGLRHSRTGLLIAMEMPFPRFVNPGIDKQLQEERGKHSAHNRRCALTPRRSSYSMCGLPSLKKKLLAGGLRSALVSHLSKYRSLMSSLALLFELADQAAAGVLDVFGGSNAGGSPWAPPALHLFRPKRP